MISTRHKLNKNTMLLKKGKIRLVVSVLSASLFRSSPLNWTRSHVLPCNPLRSLRKRENLIFLAVTLRSLLICCLRELQRSSIKKTPLSLSPIKISKLYSNCLNLLKLNSNCLSPIKKRKRRKVLSNSQNFKKLNVKRKWSHLRNQLILTKEN